MSYHIPSNSMKTCKMKSRKQPLLLLNKRMVWPDLFLGAARKISWPWERFEQGGQCGKLYFTKMKATVSSHPNIFYDCATLPSRGEMCALFPRNWMGLGDYLDHQSSTKCHSVSFRDSVWKCHIIPPWEFCSWNPDIMVWRSPRNPWRGLTRRGTEDRGPQSWLSSSQ